MIQVSSLSIHLIRIKSLQVLLPILPVLRRFLSREVLFLQISGAEQKQIFVKSLEKIFIFWLLAVQAETSVRATL